MAGKRKLDEFKEKAEKLLPACDKNIPHYLERLGLKSGEPIYKEIIEIALNKEIPIADRKDFLKFVADRVVAKRQTKMIYIKGLPYIGTLEDIMVASRMIHEKMCEGELTPEEAESFFRIYDNLREILASQQLKVLAEEAIKMKENVIQTLSDDMIFQEAANRLKDSDIAAAGMSAAFKRHFKNYLHLDNLLAMIKLKMEVPDQKTRVLTAIKEMLK